MKFAIIKNDIVINVVEADSIEIAKAVTGENNVVETNRENIAHIGLGFDGTNFEQPVIEEA